MNVMTQSSHEYNAIMKHRKGNDTMQFNSIQFKLMRTICILGIVTEKKQRLWK